MDTRDDHLFRLLAPGGKPPKPAKTPLGARTAGNLWNVHSPKMGRELFLNSDLEKDNWVHVETDPRVLWFCEHYPEVRIEVEGRQLCTIFDMLICWGGNNFSLRRVEKGRKDNATSGTRVCWDLRAQQAFACQTKIPFEVFTEKQIRNNPLYLKNWQEILGYLRGGAPMSLMKQVLAFIDQKSLCKLVEIVNHLNQEDPEMVIRSVFFLLHKGTLEAPLDSQPLSGNLPVKRSSNGREWHSN